MAREVYIEDYGGAGDGVYKSFSAGTDNSAALALAIAALPATGGGVVRFRDLGIYRFSVPPILPADVLLLGKSGLPGLFAPILQYGGGGVFLNLNQPRIGLMGLRLIGTTGTAVKVGDQYGMAENVSVADFDCGWDVSPNAGKMCLYFRGKNLQAEQCGDGAIFGDGQGTSNAHLIEGFTLNGNARDGVKVNKCNGLEIQGLVSEGNGTSGAGANINLVRGQVIRMAGFTEMDQQSATRKDVIWPGDNDSNNIELFITGNGAGYDSFYADRARSFFMTNARQFGNGEPARWTNLAVNALSMADPGANVIGPVLELADGPFVAGCARANMASSIGSYRNRNKRSLANDGALNLTDYLRGCLSAVDGLLFVISEQDGAMALFLLAGGNVATYLSPSSVFSAVKDAGFSTNVYRESGYYWLQNKTGGTRNYSLHMLTVN